MIVKKCRDRDAKKLELTVRQTGGYPVAELSAMLAALSLDLIRHSF